MSNNTKLVIKSLLATIITLFLIMLLAVVEVEYTHGLITIGLMVACVIGAMTLLFMVIFDS